MSFLLAAVLLAGNPHGEVVYEPDMGGAYAHGVYQPLWPWAERPPGTARLNGWNKLWYRWPSFQAAYYRKHMNYRLVYDFFWHQKPADAPAQAGYPPYFYPEQVPHIPPPEVEYLPEYERPPGISQSRGLSVPKVEIR